MKYRVEGREKKLGFGTYPEVSLSDARKRREEAREQLAAGRDASREKQRDKVRSRIDAGNTFTAIAAEYCAKRRRDGEKAWAPATKLQRQRANAARSQIRSAVEHVFAAQKHRMGLFIRTIGIDRAKAKIGLANIAFNFKRFLYWEAKMAAT